MRPELSYSDSYFRLSFIGSRFPRVSRGIAWGYQEPGLGPFEHISLGFSYVRPVSCLDMTLELLVSQKKSSVKTSP
jgi:hypothetical protein